jgi:hypothetical protein
MPVTATGTYSRQLYADSTQWVIEGAYGAPHRSREGRRARPTLQTPRPLPLPPRLGSSPLLQSSSPPPALLRAAGSQAPATVLPREPSRNMRGVTPWEGVCRTNARHDAANNAAPQELLPSAHTHRPHRHAPSGHVTLRAVGSAWARRRRLGRRTAWARLRLGLACMIGGSGARTPKRSSTNDINAEAA